jgi:effector-binding domain-containing protein
MLTLPKIVDREAEPYVAVRRQVTIPFGEAIGEAMGALNGWMKANGVEPAGPLFFKYNLVKMPELEMEFGFPVAKPVAASGDVVAGTIPAGRYATLTYWGHYDNLMDVTATLIGWARQTGVEWDSRPEEGGERFVSRLEIYTNDMDTLPPEKWETVLAFKVRS